MAIRKWVGYVLTFYPDNAPLLGCYVAVALTIEARPGMKEDSPASWPSRQSSRSYLRQQSSSPECGFYDDSPGVDFKRKGQHEQVPQSAADYRPVCRRVP